MLIDTLKWRCWNAKQNHMAYDEWPCLPCRPTKVPLFMANTGLLDANGNEIWEGDIVFIKASPLCGHFYYDTVHYGQRGEVAYHTFPQPITIRLKCPNLPVLNSPELRDLVEHRIVVVGNIHESPELLNTRICTTCKTLKVGETFSIRYSDKPCSKCEEHHRNIFKYPVKPFHNPEMLGAKIVALVFDEDAVTPPAKPKTIAAYHWNVGTDHNSFWFEIWARSHSLYCFDTRSFEEDDRRWAWSGHHFEIGNCLLENLGKYKGTIRTHITPIKAGQWVIKEGDTWRVADKLEKER